MSSIKYLKFSNFCNLKLYIKNKFINQIENTPITFNLMKFDVHINNINNMKNSTITFSKFTSNKKM